MKRRFNPYNLPPFAQKIKFVCGQFIIPITVFQAIRTFFFPTPFDFFLLALLIVAAFSLRA
ncbi:hypothetical protein IEO70_05510 [Bacillus sp. AGMB 02131]|uniref:Uncharacterized protein n=1 Tax=Peribacillus faecalis TaxID=2772559 RepID=A0A927CW20_9BACI|nr:hypothetical protein [Peribacillus faecalis]MBD3107817.1 hypothetical protein [Peribacillus faecalis]